MLLVWPSLRPTGPRARPVAAVLLGTVLSLTAAACTEAGGSTDDPQQTANNGSNDDPPTPTNTAGAVQLSGQWPLTGETLDGDLPDHPVYAVKIDNTAGSEPQIGLSSADMIVEEVVEGGLTRLAVFYYSTVPKVAGPARSMRASDIGIVKPVNAVMVASGGAPVTNGRIAAAHIDTLTQGTTDLFFRDESGVAPYNLFVHLARAAANPGGKWTAPTEPYLPFGDGSDFTGSITAKTIDAKFSDSHTTRWEYSDGGWTRPGSYAKPGDDFVTDNVLLLRVKVGDAGYVDASGARVPETFFFGRGEATLVHGDQALKCFWTKKTKSSALKLSTAAGQSVTVPVGHTWIELIPTETGSVTLGK